jgi:hypothetical protein
METEIRAQRLDRKQRTGVRRDERVYDSKAGERRHD